MACATARAGVVVNEIFYNAPDEASVERARQAVGTPFDRLFKLNV